MFALKNSPFDTNVAQKKDRLIAVSRNIQNGMLNWASSMVSISSTFFVCLFENAIVRTVLIRILAKIRNIVDVVMCICLVLISSSITYGLCNAISVGSLVFYNRTSIHVLHCYYSTWYNIKMAHICFLEFIVCIYIYFLRMKKRRDDNVP